MSAIGVVEGRDGWGIGLKDRLDWGEVPEEVLAEPPAGVGPAGVQLAAIAITTVTTRPLVDMTEWVEPHHVVHRR
jgi:hypothetical protein